MRADGGVFSCLCSCLQLWAIEFSGVLHDLTPDLDITPRNTEEWGLFPKLLLKQLKIVSKTVFKTSLGYILNFITKHAYLFSYVKSSFSGYVIQKMMGFDFKTLYDMNILSCLLCLYGNVSLKWTCHAKSTFIHWRHFVVYLESLGVQKNLNLVSCGAV